jgi:hypothetical protein
VVPRNQEPPICLQTPSAGWFLVPPYRRGNQGTSSCTWFRIKAELVRNHPLIGEE